MIIFYSPRILIEKTIKNKLYKSRRIFYKSKKFKLYIRRIIINILNLNYLSL